MKLNILRLLLCCQALASPAGAVPTAARPWTLEAGAEHLWPTKPDRRIQTTSLNVVVGRQVFDSCCFAWRAGITATSATGYIMQLDQRLEDIRLESNAVGIGPTLMLRLQTPELARCVLSLEGSGAFILYGHAFPAGGDIYNFMWRAGPSLSFRIDETWSVGAGARLMHVSNGQGLTPKNPSYAALGGTVWLAWRP